MDCAEQTEITRKSLAMLFPYTGVWCNEQAMNSDYQEKPQIKRTHPAFNWVTFGSQ